MAGGFDCCVSCSFCAILCWQSGYLIKGSCFSLLFLSFFIFMYVQPCRMPSGALCRAPSVPRKRRELSAPLGCDGKGTGKYSLFIPGSLISVSSFGKKLYFGMRRVVLSNHCVMVAARYWTLLHLHCCETRRSLKLAQRTLLLSSESDAPGFLIHIFLVMDGSCP